MILEYCLKELNDLTRQEIESFKQVLKACPEGTVFNDIELQATAYRYFKEGKGYVLYFIRNENIVGYFTFFHLDKNGTHYLSSPYQKSLIPYGGLILDKKYKNHEKNILRIIRSFLNARSRVIYIKSNPELDISTYTKSGFKNKMIPTLMIDLNKSESQIWDSFQNRTRRNIKKAEKNRFEIRMIRPESQDAIEPLTLIYRKLCETKNIFYHNSGYYFSLLENIDKKYGARIFYAINQGKIVSAMSICQYNNVLNPWFGGTLNEFTETGAGSLIYWEILKYGNINGFKKFDFLGLDIPTIAFYKKGFGGSEVPVYHLSYSSYYYKAINKIRKWGF